MALRVWRRRSNRRAVSPILATVFLVALTLTAGILIWTLQLHPTPALPMVYYQAEGGITYPVWGDPTDLNATTGLYSNMNASIISITKVTEPVPLKAVQFTFVCHNDTPTPVTTLLVSGSLAAMSWFPGSSQTIPTNAPTLGYCATFNANGLGAFSTFYNRLGFYEPLTLGASLLEAGDAFILYLHTPRSVLEGNHPDVDDYHGAPPWCFVRADACTIYLTDTQTSASVVLAKIPVIQLA